MANILRIEHIPFEAPGLEAGRNVAEAGERAVGTPKQIIARAKANLPKMHKGGTVKKSGAYVLKAGEQVLTAKQAAKAKALKAALSKAGLASAGRKRAAK